jgi:hypothetical protein
MIDNIGWGRLRSILVDEGVAEDSLPKVSPETTPTKVDN